MSTDQCECRVTGQLPNTRGKEDPHRMYSGGIVFVDISLSMIVSFNQVGIRTVDSIRSKDIYKMACVANGVKVQIYHEDMGVHKSDTSKENLDVNK